MRSSLLALALLLAVGCEKLLEDVTTNDDDATSDYKPGMMIVDLDKSEDDLRGLYFGWNVGEPAVKFDPHAGEITYGKGHTPTFWEAIQAAYPEVCAPKEGDPPSPKGCTLHLVR